MHVSAFIDEGKTHTTNNSYTPIHMYLPFCEKFFFLQNFFLFLIGQLKSWLKKLFCSCLFNSAKFVSGQRKATDQQVGA